MKPMTTIIEYDKVNGFRLSQVGADGRAKYAGPIKNARIVLTPGEEPKLDAEADHEDRAR